mmetsp:Transcript_40073/g.67199  ORF Transcript_40073/g.67199 Transcript_40073/m.67199 type:complete len:482 (+) Transcript_40073:132-1577(+)
MASNENWARIWNTALDGLHKLDPIKISYEESAAFLRSLIKTRLLKHTDLRDNPERFFLAHKLVALKTFQLHWQTGSAFWIRFTVHYNLCVGTVLALGNEGHIKSLQDMQTEGQLGCFGLTEKHAGVSSGLVVEATADYNPDTREFILNTVEEGSAKNWISSGLVADKTVVVANLRLKGKSYGPHAFLIDMRRNGELVPGVMVGDMGRKTLGNDLDNAWIMFNDVNVPYQALLDKYAEVDAGHNYVPKLKGVPEFHRIGQRLFTGRVAVAQAALEFRRWLFAKTTEYANERQCWTPAGDRPLAEVPQLKQLLQENDRNQREMDVFVSECEAQLCVCLRADVLPSVTLCDAIAVAKAKAVEDSIQFVNRLSNEVGSYALMAGSGFDKRDFLIGCKFAEGDTRVLMQKIARDRMRQFGAKEAKHVPPGQYDAEMRQCANLVAALKAGGGPAAWDLNHLMVYKLAEIVMDRIVRDFVNAPIASKL